MEDEKKNSGSEGCFVNGVICFDPKSFLKVRNRIHFSTAIENRKIVGLIYS